MSSLRVAADAARSMGGKEDTYRQYVTDVHYYTKSLADELGKGDMSVLHKDTHKKLVDRLEDLATGDTKADLEVTAYFKAISALAQDIGAQTPQEMDSIEETNIEDYKAIIQEKVKAAMIGIDEQIKGTKMFKDIMKTVRSGEDDDDLEVMAGELSIKCPLTNATFKEPVKSKKCGHTFDKNAVIYHIRVQRQNCVCPVAGCNKKLAMEDLVPDKEMERELTIRQNVEKEVSRHNSADVIESDEEEDVPMTYL
ncbi:unnamed protein product [Choristocarpus tenellus]